jgi:hypothetical protein
MVSIANFDNVNTSQDNIILKVFGGHRLRHVRGEDCGAIPIAQIPQQHTMLPSFTIMMKA